MRKTIRLITLLLCLTIALGVLAGCKKDEEISPSALLSKADNEILFYEKVDPTKTQLVLSVTGNIAYGRLSAAFEKKYPDVQIIQLDITGGNAESLPFVDWLENGLIPDIAVMAPGICADSHLEKYFEELSSNTALAKYQTEALNKVSVSQKIYTLPGLSKLNGLLYNKTLFEQYGWQVPKTFDEFIALCVQITADTNGTVEPWNPNAKYSEEIASSLQAFSYGSVFAGADNRKWLNDFINGDATYAEHMQPFYDNLEKLIKNGVLKEGQFDDSATQRGYDFRDGKIAIVNGSINNFPSGDLFEFGNMPFPGTSETDSWLIDVMDSEIGVPKRERSPAVRKAVDDFIAFLASVEGQQAYIGDTMLVSNLKDFPMDDASHLVGLVDTINAGHLFASVQFKNETNSATVSFGTEALAMAKGYDVATDTFSYTSAASMAHVDANAHKGTSEKVAPEVVATATDNFTSLELSNYYADMFREETGADVALIPHGIAYRGNLMHLFRGEINTVDVTVLKPRSYANGSKLVKVKMTGKQLLDAMNLPVGNDRATDCLYAFSGLSATVAPWNALGEKYLSVTLADGTAIDQNKLYTVAFWQGSVYDGTVKIDAGESPCFVTETVQAYDGTFESLLTKHLKADGTISPAKDGRMTIIWD